MKTDNLNTRSLSIDEMFFNESLKVPVLPIVNEKGGEITTPVLITNKVNTLKESTPIDLAKPQLFDSTVNQKNKWSTTDIILVIVIPLVVTGIVVWAYCQAPQKKIINAKKVDQLKNHLNQNEQPTNDKAKIDDKTNVKENPGNDMYALNVECYGPPNISPMNNSNFCIVASDLDNNSPSGEMQ
jgi:Fe2+ transport system protein B